MRIIDYDINNNEEVFKRTNVLSSVSLSVKEIVENVKKNGDKALREYTEKFDGVRLDDFIVCKDEIDEALKECEEDFLLVLKKAKERIYNYHKRQVRNSFVSTDDSGIILGQRVLPLEKVGIYVPGGTAQYPSTVLMDCIPAKVAGCKCVVMVTPPGKDGKISKYVLASAYIAGVDKIYKVGGAQAIAALAYGTETIDRVDKIVGPGNAYVAQAKKEVSSLVSIDMVAGPSEILIISDSTCDARLVAIDLLSQAEHDKNASSVLIITDRKKAEEVSREVEERLKTLPREEIARESITNNGKIIVVPTVEKAIEISNSIAPEHLELFIDNPFDYLSLVKNAGSVFLGKNTPEAVGDYFAGPNHTLPTNGSARFSSPLSVDDFVKKYQFSYYTKQALNEQASSIALFARKEGLEAHALSALSRGELE